MILILVISGLLLLFIKHEKKSYQLIFLSQPLDSKIVVFETERVILSFGLNDFKHELEYRIRIMAEKKNDDPYFSIVLSSYSGNEEEELLSFIEEESKTKDKIELSNMPRKIEPQRDSSGPRYIENTLTEYLVANLLRYGPYIEFGSISCQCTLFDKKKKTYIDRIKFENLSSTLPDGKIEGIRFILPKDKTVFLEARYMDVDLYKF